MTLVPFRFDLVFTGLCLFVIDDNNEGATILLVNATNPKRFQNDPATSSLGSSIPHPHFPRFSYLMTQQIRKEGPHRLPNRVFAGQSGEEIGVCDLEGEDLTLVTGASLFQSGSLGEAPKLSSMLPVKLSPLCNSPIPNFVVTSRMRITSGTLETLRVGFAGEQQLLVDFRTINNIGSPSGNPDRTIADQLILRIENLTDPIEIRSNSGDPITLRPDLDADGETLRTVVASLSNFHQEFFAPDIAAYDFLWFYEMIDFTAEPRPSRRDLPIPVYINGDGGFTGTSGACPPIRF